MENKKGKPFSGISMVGGEIEKAIQRERGGREGERSSNSSCKAYATIPTILSIPAS
jgi:hypothetical protein